MRTLRCVFLLGALLLGGCPEPTCGTLAAGGAFCIAEVTLLGTLGGSESAALALNDQGQIVGWSHLPDDTARGFLWQDGAMEALGLLDGDEESTARDINNAGVIIGTSERDVTVGTGTYHPVRFGNEVEPLPGLNQDIGWAAGVNESGQIAGYSYNMANEEVAVIWDANLQINAIGLQSDAERTRAFGLNDQGEAVGWQYNAFSGEPNDAFHWDGTSWNVIGGIDMFQNAEASTINESGVIAGLNAPSGGDWTGSLWMQDGSAIDCGALPGHNLSELYGLNDRNLAVGRSSSTDASSAILCNEAGELTDLNDLAPKNFGGHLRSAHDINERGDIVGVALEDGLLRAFILTFSVQ